LLTVAFPAATRTLAAGADVACAVAGATTAAVAEPGLGWPDGVVALTDVGAETEAEAEVVPLPIFAPAAGAAAALAFVGAETLTAAWPAPADTVGAVLRLTETLTEAGTADPLPRAVADGSDESPPWLGAWTVTGEEPSASATRPVR
jgi:hypothetical protein